jgi:Holliday junction resolvase RusA-like endonuclease
MNPQPPVEFHVDGTPVPQGSMVATRFGGVRHEKASALALWRAQIGLAVRAAAENNALLLPLEGPLELSVAFHLARPKSAPKRRTRPDVKPDADKLLRAAMDALTQAGAWIDDAQVVDVYASKNYVGATPLSTRPGAHIVIKAAS